MALMTRRTSPRWMRIAACLALESRRVVLVRDGHPVFDACSRCGTDGLCNIRAFHKGPDGQDARCVLVCGACSHLVEDRSLEELEAREENPLKGLRDAF